MFTGSVVCSLCINFWFCFSTMMLMERVERMEVTIILAGIVVLKVRTQSATCILISVH